MTAAAYLLDANLLIGALDSQDGNPEHDRAKTRLDALMADPDARLMITPLIRYEVLRGVKSVSIEEMSEALDGFFQLDVKHQDGLLAARIYAQAQTLGRPINKRTFDVFHCVAAHRNQLEVASRDGDIPHIMEMLEQVVVS